MLQSAPGIDRVIREFSDFAGDSVLMAHNAPFDMNFLYAAYERVLGRPLINDYVDTLRVARRAFPELQHRRLPDLCGELGVVNDHEHRALSDVVVMVTCYGSMREMVLERYGSEESYRKSFTHGGSSNSLKASEISAECDADEGNPLYRMHCAFTGKMTKMVRRDAMQALANVGGIPEDGVKKDTDYLVIGNDGFRDAMKTTSGKIKKAQQNQLKGLPIQIISENTFLELLNG